MAAGGRNAGHCKLYQQMANRKVTNVCDYVTTVTNCLSSGRDVLGLLVSEGLAVDEVCS